MAPELDTLNQSRSQSEFALYHLCEQKGKFKYVDRLDVIGAFNINLWVGNQFHNFLESYYNALGNGVAFEFVDFCQPDDSDIFLTEENQFKLVMFGLLFKEYQKQYIRIYQDEQARFNFKDAKVEEIVVKNNYTGKLDIQFASGDVSIMDHKTCTDLSGRDSLDKHKHQILFYAYLSDKLEGKAVINEIRKYGQKRTLKDITPQMFAARIIADMRENPFNYFKRTTLSYAKEDVQQFLTSAISPMARNILQIEKGQPPMRNYNACQAFGYRCEFYELCFPTEDNPLSRYRVRDAKHAELIEE